MSTIMAFHIIFQNAFALMMCHHRGAWPFNKTPRRPCEVEPNGDLDLGMMCLSIIVIQFQMGCVKNIDLQYSEVERH